MNTTVWMIIAVVAVLAAALCIIVIRKKEAHAAGRNTFQVENLNKEKAAKEFVKVAETIISGAGGKENIASVEHCETRLKLQVKDRTIVDDDKLKSSGAAAVLHPGKTAAHIVLGPKTPLVYAEVTKLLQ